MKYDMKRDWNRRRISTSARRAADVILQHRDSSE